MTTSYRVPEPRPVSPKAILRWFRTGAALQWKAFLPLFVLGFVGLSIVALLAMSTFLSHLVLLLTHLMGVAICASADVRNPLNLGELRKCLLKIMPACVVASYSLVGLALANLIYDIASGHSPFTYIFDPAAKASFTLFDFDSALAAYLLVRIILSLYPYTFHLYALAGHDLMDSAKKGGGGRPAINCVALTALDVITIGLLAVISVFFAPAAPILMGFFSAISYVSYREIYLGVADNATEQNPRGVAVVQH